MSFNLIKLYRTKPLVKKVFGKLAFVSVEWDFLLVNGGEI